MERETARATDPASARWLRAVLERHGFRPRKSLGQTFLVDGNIVRKIVETAQIARADSVLEIGAGAGAVTRALVEAAGRVVAIEIDPVLVGVLREVVADRAEIVQADVLEVAWSEVLGAGPSASPFAKASADKPLRAGPRGQWKVVANLPYSITGPAILRLLEAREWLAQLVIMVQREVAERLAAEPGERARGQLSVLVQAACKVRVAGQVSRNCFWPRPKVDSTIMALEVRRPALVRPDLEPVFQQLVRAAFATRRKTVLNALANAGSRAGGTAGSPRVRSGRAFASAFAEATADKPLRMRDKELVRSLLERCGIAPGLRAEALGTDDFLRLAQTVVDWRTPASAVAELRRPRRRKDEEA